MKNSQPSVLFICSGNTCRSPMAASLFLEMLKERNHHGWRVESAGTGALEGQPASDHAVQVMAERGISLAGHRSRVAAPQLLKGFDLILAMEDRHKIALLDRASDAAARIYLLGEMADMGKPSGSPESVEDPFGDSLEMYRKTARQIERLLHEGLDRILELVEAKRSEYQG